MSDTKRPKFRVYVADSDGKIDYKNEAFALWENATRDRKVYYGGKLKDGRKVQMWAMLDKQDEGGDDSPAPKFFSDSASEEPEDVPF